MKYDALRDSLAHLPRYNLCIVGSGPVGLAVAAELADTGARICVLESGSEKRPSEANRLRTLRSKGITIREDSRERVLGGATETWGALSAPPDPIDFAPERGWPISFDELFPYLEQAAERYAFPAPKLFSRPSVLLGGEGVPQSLEAKVFLKPKGKPMQFGRALSYIFSHPGIDLITNATVVKLQTDRVNISAATIKTLADGEATIRADHFLLAANAIENARLLLVSAIGNEHDQVGRYFMNRPKGYSGFIRFTRPVSIADPAFRLVRDGFVGYAGLRIAEEMQSKKYFRNCYVNFEPQFLWTGNPQWKAFLSVFKNGAQFIRAMRTSRTKAPAAFSAFLSSLTALRPSLAPLLMRRVMAGRRPSPRNGRLRSYIDMEPRAENRITLTKECDLLNVPVPFVAHAPSEHDMQSLRYLHETLARDLHDSGIGELIYDPARLQVLVSTDASHHLGGTRMGKDPALSVVDVNCRVHGVANLYIAGGSVFPNSGCANPTMVMVALSIRLAEHLRGILGVHTQRHTRGKRAIVIGAGRRVLEDVLPALESLEDVEITKFFAHGRRTLFGSKKRYDVLPFAELSAGDVASANLMHVAVPSGAVRDVMRALTTHDCAHIDLVLDTPVLLAPAELREFSSRFHSFSIAEDSVLLPWIETVRAVFSDEGPFGRLRTMTFRRSLFRYHGISLIKTLCGTQTLPAAIPFCFRIASRIWMPNVAGISVMMQDPRDYATGDFVLRGARGTVADREEANTTPLLLQLSPAGLCEGFRIGTIKTPLTPEESVLAGYMRREDTVVTRMLDFKRVGLRRLYAQVLQGNVPWSWQEAYNDVRLDTASHRFGMFL